MYAKLAFRGAKQAAKDYLIYLITLTLAVALFYAFLSITSPYYQRRLPVQFNLEYMSRIIRTAVPLLSVLMVFLVSYVNRYMIRRRQRELAMQMVMGMEPHTMAAIFFLQILMMGIIAVVTGIALGLLLSEMVSAIIFSSFGEPYQISFPIYPDTAAWTVLFFLLLLGVTGVMNVRRIRKCKIIELLQDSQKTESGATLRSVLIRWVALGSVLMLLAVFLVMNAMLPLWGQLPSQVLIPCLLCVVASVLYLGAALTFLLTTRSGADKGTAAALVMAFSILSAGICLLSMTDFFDHLVRQGWRPPAYASIPTLFGVIDLVLCLILLFGVYGRILVWVKQWFPRIAVKELFLFGQITAKLGSNGKTMAVLSCVLIASVTLLCWMPVYITQVDGYLKYRSIYDVQVFSTYRGTSELLTSSIDYSYIDEYLKAGDYAVTGSANVETFFLRASDADIVVQKDMPVLAVSLSDYNSLRRLSGFEAVSLDENAFATDWSNRALPHEIEALRKEHPTIRTGAGTLTKADQSDYQEPVGMGIFTSRIEAIYIIPDAHCRELTMATTYYATNTSEPLPYAFASQMDGDIDSWINASSSIPEGGGFVRLRTLQLNEGISNSLMLRLCSAYSCGMCSSATSISLAGDCEIAQFQGDTNSGVR